MWSWLSEQLFTYHHTNCWLVSKQSSCLSNSMQTSNSLSKTTEGYAEFTSINRYGNTSPKIEPLIGMTLFVKYICRQGHYADKGYTSLSPRWFSQRNQYHLQKLDFVQQIFMECRLVETYTTSSYHECATKKYINVRQTEIWKYRSPEPPWRKMTMLSLGSGKASIKKCKLERRQNT